MYGFYSYMKAIEIGALKSFVQDFTKGREGVRISYILIRNGIESVNDLRNVDIARLRSIRGVGPKRIETIIKMKETLSEN